MVDCRQPDRIEPDARSCCSNHGRGRTRGRPWVLQWTLSTGLGPGCRSDRRPWPDRTSRPCVGLVARSRCLCGSNQLRALGVAGHGHLVSVAHPSVFLLPDPHPDLAASVADPLGRLLTARSTCARRRNVDPAVIGRRWPVAAGPTDPLPRSVAYPGHAPHPLRSRRSGPDGRRAHPRRRFAAGCRPACHPSHERPVCQQCGANHRRRHACRCRLVWRHRTETRCRRVPRRSCRHRSRDDCHIGRSHGAPPQHRHGGRRMSGPPGRIVRFRHLTGRHRPGADPGPSATARPSSAAPVTRQENTKEADAYEKRTTSLVKWCPAASYSPTRWPTQYHRR